MLKTTIKNKNKNIIFYTYDFLSQSMTNNNIKILVHLMASCQFILYSKDKTSREGLFFIE